MTRLQAEAKGQRLEVTRMKVRQQIPAILEKGNEFTKEKANFKSKGKDA